MRGCMAAPSFETGAARPPQDEAAQGIPNPRLVAEPFAIIPSHDVKQPISFPRRMSAPGVCDFASLTPNRGVGGAPIRHPPVLTSPQVTPGYFNALFFFACVVLTPPLASSAFIVLNRDRAEGRPCAPGTSFLPPSYAA